MNKYCVVISLVMFFEVIVFGNFFIFDKGDVEEVFLIILCLVFFIFLVSLFFILDNSCIVVFVWFKCEVFLCKLLLVL